MALIALQGPVAAQARERVGAFVCTFGDERAHVLVPRAREAASDDEMQCRAELWGVGWRRGERLAGEVRLHVPGRPPRTVATGTFQPVDGSPDRAALRELFVPHTTWFPGVRWASAHAPRLRLTLVVFRKAESERRRRARWQQVTTRDLELGRS